MKTCSKCKISKSEDLFYKNKDRVGKLYPRGSCKDCDNTRLTDSYRKNKEFYSKKSKIYYALNSEAIKKNVTIWRHENRGKTKSYVRMTQAKRSRRVPTWITQAQTDEIKKIYLNCPVGYQVDHIIPLNGKLVSGLHLPNNLQYLKKEDNGSKLNKFIPTVQNFKNGIAVESGV